MCQKAGKSSFRGIGVLVTKEKKNVNITDLGNGEKSKRRDHLERKKKKKR